MGEIWACLKSEWNNSIVKSAWKEGVTEKSKTLKYKGK